MTNFNLDFDFVDELPKVKGRGRKPSITDQHVANLIQAGNAGKWYGIYVESRSKAQSKVAAIKARTPEGYDADVTTVTVEDAKYPTGTIFVGARYVAHTPQVSTPEDSDTPDSPNVTRPTRKPRTRRAR